MNVIYRVHGAGGFYMETQSQDQAFRAARQEAAASGQIELVLGGTERTIVVEDFEEIYREEA